MILPSDLLEIYTLINETILRPSSFEQRDREITEVLQKVYDRGYTRARVDASKDLRDWADTFGCGPTAEGIRKIVNEAADRVNTL